MSFKVSLDLTSIREACRKTGFQKTTLSACLNGRLKTAYDFIWQKGIGPAQITVNFKNRKVQVVQCMAKGKKLATFPSMLEAADHTNIPYHRIRDATTSQRLADGYYWRTV